MRKQFFTLITAGLLAASCGNTGPEWDASGVFEATEVTLSAKSQGEITELLADEGDSVSTGQKLAQIDVRQLMLTREQLAHSRQGTDAGTLDLSKQLSVLEQQLGNATRERERFSALLKDNAATQKQVDDIDYQISVLNRQIAALRDQITSSNQAMQQKSSAMGAQISQVDVQIADASVTSPISGTVLERYCEKGEYAMPGRKLFKIADLSQMTLRAYITASQYNTLKLGQEVRISIDGRAEPYQGKVSWISQRAEFTPKTIQTKDERANLVYAIKIKVKNDGLIKIGMYGDCSFD